MRYCFAALYVLIAGPVFADDGFIDLVQKLEKQNAAKAKAPCGCASPCPCAAGECGSAACPTAAKPTRARPANDELSPGNPWQWDAKEGYWWRWAPNNKTVYYDPSVFQGSPDPFSAGNSSRRGVFQGGIRGARFAGGCGAGG